MSDSSYTTTLNILMVEDQRVAGASLRGAIAGLQMPYNLTICSSSVEALTHLRGDGPPATVSRPDVVVLDGAVSEGERRALLTAIQHDAALHQIPVIIVTDSPDQDESTGVYYIPLQKVTPQILAPVLRSTHAIAAFWSLLVTLFASEEEGTPAGRSAREEPGNVPSLDVSAKKR